MCLTTLLAIALGLGGLLASAVRLVKRGAVRKRATRSKRDMAGSPR
jgi:hypothetical protein